MPFMIAFYSDDNEVAAESVAGETNNKGFQLMYELINCA